MIPPQEAHAAEAAAPEVAMISPSEIAVPPGRRRKPLDVTDERDRHFVESIEKAGLLQPIRVRRLPDGSPHRYELVFGQRRLAAARYLELDAIPAFVVAVTDRQMASLTLIENTMRRQMDYHQYIRALRDMLREIERAYGPDPGRKASGYHAARSVDRNPTTNQFVAAASTDGITTEPLSAPGALNGQDSPAPLSHAALISEAAGRSSGGFGEDLRAAKAFTDDQLRVLQSFDLSRSQMIALSQLPEGDARSEAIATLVVGDGFDAALAAGRKAGKAPPKPPTEDDLDDATWLEQYCGLRILLQDPRSFDRAALLWRHDKGNRGAHRLSARQEVTRCLERGYDPLSRLIWNCLWADHPSRWAVCEACQGRNADKPDCDFCYGAGYKLRAVDRKDDRAAQTIDRLGL